MFVVSAYDLHTGEEVHHRESEKIESALTDYQLAVLHYRNLCADDCFGVLLYTGSGNIVYGFGEE
jgi:hypothetical protein